MELGILYRNIWKYGCMELLNLSMGLRNYEYLYGNYVCVDGSLVLV